MSEPRYSHDYACTLSDGTPYRLGVRKGSPDREVHIEDAERIVRKFHADHDLAKKNWLVVFMLPPANEWPPESILNTSDPIGDEGSEEN